MVDTPFTTFAFAATGGSATRTMPARLAEIKNVRDFGALGNNSHDDTANIQAAIDYVSDYPSATTRGMVYFPPGIYKVTAPITLPSSSISLLLSGCGSASIITGTFAGFVFTQPVVQGSSSSGILVIENLHISNGQAITGGAIKLGAKVASTVRNCVIGADQGINCTASDSDEQFASFSMLIESCVLAPTSNYTTGTNGIVIVSNSNVLNCDMNSYDVGIRMYGYANNVIGGRIETSNTGIMVGQTVDGTQKYQSGGSIQGISFESNNTAIDFFGGAQMLVAGVKAHGFEGASPNMTTHVRNANPQYIFNFRGDSASTAVIACDCGGQVQQYTINVGESAGNNPNHVTFISCTTSNGSTLGGQRWGMPTYPVAGTFINCDNPALVYVFAKLPSGGNVTEGMEYDISDSTTATWGATAAGGGSNHVKVRYNGTNWTVVGK